MLLNLSKLHQKKASPGVFEREFTVHLLLKKLQFSGKHGRSKMRPVIVFCHLSIDADTSFTESDLE